MKKILTILGARPQFIKAAPFSQAVRNHFQEVIIHTGQHYDDNMSRIFFDEMGIPKPDYNLNVRSGTHGKQTAQMLKGIEEILLKEKPDYVVVFGDTNSTIAGALAAAKLHIPVGHIEAGLRSFNRKMPEEINRITTDVISAQLFCPTANAVSLLAKEGIKNEVYLCGDIMYDAMQHFLPVSKERSKIVCELGLNTGGYILFTMHRPENTDNINRIRNIFKALKNVDIPIIYPVHPRMRARLESHEMESIVSNIPMLRVIDPIGYLDMIALEKNANKIITDSGGMQKEAFFLQVPCITIRNESEWIETVDLGYNIIVGADTDKIVEAIQSFDPVHEVECPYGSGDSAELITKAILSYLN